MAFKLEKATDYFLLDTPVENIFINEYMVSSPGEYVKVYLFALMYARLGSEFSNEDIAKQLGMQHEDVLKAWSFWESRGVIKKHRKSEDNKFDYDVEFVMLKSQLYGQSESSSPAIDDGINLAMSNEEIKLMLQDIEKILGRILSSTEVSEISSWASDYSISPELIAYCFEYCAGLKKTSLRYVGTVVKEWALAGLKDVIAVEKMLSQREKKQFMYKRVFDALGFKRNATEEEKRIMDTWYDEMNFSQETVLKACGKTAGIPNPNINYVNKVLKNWFEEGERPEKNDDAPSTSEIMNYYELLRNKEKAEADKRRRYVMQQVPRIKEIDNEAMRLTSEMSKIIVSDRVDKKEATDSIKERMDSLNAERAFLLTDNGFELDYTDIRFECPKCKDTGILDETGERCQCFVEITKEKIKLLKVALQK